MIIRLFSISILVRNFYYAEISRKPKAVKSDHKTYIIEMRKYLDNKNLVNVDTYSDSTIVYYKLGYPAHHILIAVVVPFSNI